MYNIDMKINPNYSKQHICNFCKKNIADFECEASSHLYCLSISGLLSYKFKTATVVVPRCKKCKRKHTISYLPGAIIALIIYAWVMTKTIVPIWKVTHSIGENIIGTIMMLMVTTFLAWIPLAISHLIFSFVVGTKPKVPMFIDNYEPVRKLREIGFTHVFDGKTTDYPQTTPFTEESLSDCLKSIIEKDNCVVYDDKFKYEY